LGNLQFFRPFLCSTPPSRAAPNGPMSIPHRIDGLVVYRTAMPCIEAGRLCRTQESIDGLVGKLLTGSIRRSQAITHCPLNWQVG
jgi:hypothetical protein